jgi:hypothetical protein
MRKLILKYDSFLVQIGVGDFHHFENISNDFFGVFNYKHFGCTFDSIQTHKTPSNYSKCDIIWARVSNGELSSVLLLSFRILALPCLSSRIIVKFIQIFRHTLNLTFLLKFARRKMPKQIYLSIKYFPK